MENESKQLIIKLCHQNNKCQAYSQMLKLKQLYYIVQYYAHVRDKTNYPRPINNKFYNLEIYFMMRSQCLCCTCPYECQPCFRTHGKIPAIRLLKQLIIAERNKETKATLKKDLFMLDPLDYTQHLL